MQQPSITGTAGDQEGDASSEHITTINSVNFTRKGFAQAEGYVHRRRRSAEG